VATGMCECPTATEVDEDMLRVTLTDIGGSTGMCRSQTMLPRVFHILLLLQTHKHRNKYLRHNHAWLKLLLLHARRTIDCPVTLVFLCRNISCPTVCRNA
jgi:hypothetical protein